MRMPPRWWRNCGAVPVPAVSAPFSVPTFCAHPDEALAAPGKARERFQFDDPDFQPFASKFDRQGPAGTTDAEPLRNAKCIAVNRKAVTHTGCKYVSRQHLPVPAGQ